MTKSLALLTLLLPVALTVGCNKSDGQQGHDHGAVDEHQTSEAASPNTDAAQQIIPISVGDEGFAPSRVELKKGQDATLRFTRTSDQTCATRVVFPELKIEKDLPLNQAVDVKVPTAEARKLAFQCGMGMYKSAVVIN